MNKQQFTCFRTKYTCRPTSRRGQKVFETSITQPDMSYSVKELVDQFSQASLPSMAVLQPWLDEAIDIEDSSNDFGFGGDKAEIFEKFLESNQLRQSIFEKLKARYVKGKAENPDFTETDATTIDGIDLEHV